MANWSGFTLTNVGAKLQAKINAGTATLTFTKLGLGSGSGSGSVNALTAMVNKVQDVTIASITANENIVSIKSVLTNVGLSAAYQMREMGLFATDPDDGEILFAYMTDNIPDTMPADGSATTVSQDITLNLMFSNTGNVSATIDTGQLVPWSAVKTVANDPNGIDNNNNHLASTSWVKRGITTHNTDATAHQTILDAIAAITGLNFGTAPSKTIANMINLIGQGGITAAKLDQNGFVKYANGFTIQWGSNTSVTSGAATIIKYPLYFSVFCVLATTIDTESGYSCFEKSLTGFKTKTYNTTFTTSTVNYLAVGL